MMETTASELTAMCDKSVRGGDLRKTYQGSLEGGTVHVIGSGPSNKAFAKHKLGIDDVVIVCNGAYIEYGNDADIWLGQESTLPAVAPWFIQDPPPTCQVILDASASGHLGAHPARVAGYPKSWWENVIWNHRWPWGKWAKDIRSYTEGLYFRSSVDEPEGTVVLQGIHLAGIMGAAEVHLWGVELYFPKGKQHSYKDKHPAYVEGEGVTAIRRFDVEDGQVIQNPDGKYESTSYFIRSAEAILEVVAHAESEHDDFKVIDHSKGLLSIGEME